MTIEFVPATREQVYSRTCVHGPGGSGKTYTGLAVMTALCGVGKFAVIDTERGRSRKYVGVNGWQFAILEPHSFDPSSLTEALGVAAGAGYLGVMIDSGSAYWNGQDGMMEQVDRRGAASGRGDKFGAGWKEMAPIERRMWDAVMTYPGHVWMTLRVASHYVVEDVQRGNRTVATPRKVGLKPVQREGFDYEFDLVGAFDQDNSMLITKSDLYSIPPGTYIPKPGVEFAQTVADFCAEGVMATGPMAYRSQALAPGATRDDLLGLLATVSTAGLINAPVTDELGHPTVLGDLIKDRGRSLGQERPTVHGSPPAAPRATEHLPAPDVAVETKITDGQFRELLVLFERLNVSDRRDRMVLSSELLNRAVENARSLTKDQATDLIKELTVLANSEDDDGPLLAADIIAHPQLPANQNDVTSAA